MPGAGHHTHGVVCAFPRQASRKPLNSLIVFCCTEKAFFNLVGKPSYRSETHFTVSEGLEDKMALSLKKYLSRIM